jgi:glucuronate isomerase
MAKYKLHPDRFFDPDPTIRKHAREIYQTVKDLPIISPHGHMDPRIFSENKPFPNPTELFLLPDHYVYRMFYSQGIKMESLGIPPIDGSEVEKDPKKIWQLFGQNYWLLNGTPSGVWLDYEFHIVFGIQEKINGDNALKIYEELTEKIQSPEFLPQALYKQFRIEALSTTNAATDTLENHRKIKESDWDGKIVPCFRPDEVTDLMYKDWQKNICLLGERVGEELTTFSKFIAALENRRKHFIAMGATSSDHGVFSAYTHELSASEAEAIFQKGLKGTSTPDDARLFTAHMLMEMARMSTQDGIVMQIHPGSYRNHNPIIFEKWGPNTGCDIPMHADFTFNLKELLNKYGNNPDLTVIVFTLDEASYSRELAPLAGHYPAMKLGPAWWFHDSIQGMTRYRQMVTETAGFYNTVGFNDDTRAFISIPARHDLARRVDSNFLGELVARHIVSQNEALVIAKDLAYDLVKKAYKL